MAIAELPVSALFWLQLTNEFTVDINPDTDKDLNKTVVNTPTYPASISRARVTGNNIISLMVEYAFEPSCHNLRMEEP